MAEISSLLGLITDDNTRQALIAQMENMFDNAPDEERLIQEIGHLAEHGAHSPFRCVVECLVEGVVGRHLAVVVKNFHVHGAVVVCTLIRALAHLCVDG